MAGFCCRFVPGNWQNHDGATEKDPHQCFYKYPTPQGRKTRLHDRIVHLCPLTDGARNSSSPSTVNNTTSVKGTLIVKKKRLHQKN